MSEIVAGLIGIALGVVIVVVVFVRLFISEWPL